MVILSVVKTNGVEASIVPKKGYKMNVCGWSRAALDEVLILPSSYDYLMFLYGIGLMPKNETIAPLEVDVTFIPLCSHLTARFL